MTKSTNDFVLEQIRNRPDVTLEELRARAALEGRRVREATFYRARVDLGLDGRSASVVATESPETQTLVDHEPMVGSPEDSVPGKGRSVRVSEKGRYASTPNDLANAIQGFVGERDRLREALLRMQTIVDEILAR